METPPIPMRVRKWLTTFEKIDGIEPAMSWDEETHSWLMLIHHEDGDSYLTFGTTFRRRKNGKIKRTYDLVINDEKIDVKDMTDAIRKIFDHTQHNSNSTPVTGPAKASRSNSVESRRASVIRV
jgi:hypothetical protein